MSHRPPEVRADPFETDLRRLFDGGRPVGGHGHRLQQLNQRRFLLASVFGAAPLADIAHERVKAASARHLNRPNRGFHGKLMTIAMHGHQLDRAARNKLV